MKKRFFTSKLAKTSLALVLFSGAINAQVPTSASVPDTRNTNELPSFYKREFKPEFKSRIIINSPGSGSYSGLFTFAPWMDFSGGSIHQLSFNEGGIFHRLGNQNDNTWKPWRQFLQADENGNVGIGTNSPTTKLDIVGALKTTGDITTNDIVSAGTNSWLFHTPDDNRTTLYVAPKTNNAWDWGNSYQFQNNGTLSFRNLNVWDQASIGSSMTVKGATTIGGILTVNHSDFILGANDGRPKGSKTGQRAMVHSSEDELILNYDGDFEGGLVLNGLKTVINGKVGIGTSAPDEMLTVKGNIHAREVRVDLKGPLADYVFQKYYTGNSNLKSDYKMPTLSEVEAFTKENHRLPNVPSAQEIQENGLKLGEMNNILLQKIEELTLYIIEQDKKIQILESKIK